MIVVLHATHYATEGGEAGGALGRLLGATLWRLGFGVPMFFVISGYCIAATSDSSRRKPHAPGQFFLRRFRRIFPPYWAIMLVSITLVIALTALGQADLVSTGYNLIPHPAALSPPQWLGNVTLTESWRWHLFGGGQLKIVGPSWTLCYEEQFYAVCGLMLIVARRRFFSGLAVVTLLSLAGGRLVLSGRGSAIDGFFFDGRWLMFAEGVGVYYLVNYGRSRRAGLLLFAALMLLALWLHGNATVAASPIARYRAWELEGSTAFALALLALHPWDRRTFEARILRPIGLCGEMCYSLYLAHWPIAAVLTTLFYRAGVRGPLATLLLAAPVTIAASLVGGYIFHVTVERRFMNTPSRAPLPPAPALPEPAG